MERLVTTSQAAQILGLSLQGVHYRIKKNQLKSIKKSGKTFVYVSEDAQSKAQTYTKVQTKSATSNEQVHAIIEVKDEQIKLLKKSNKIMRKQYISEISRLEKNQKKIIEVFKSEISLLQSAFNEMRSVYKPQIEELSTAHNVINEEKFISLQDFFILMKRYDKTQKQIKALIFQAINRADKRFIYNKTEKKLLILNSDFKDLL